MITLEINHADALTMLRSGKLTAEALSNLQSLILAALSSAADSRQNLVKVTLQSVGRVEEKIWAIKMIRAAFSNTGCQVGLKEAKDLVEGNGNYLTLLMPEKEAKELSVNLFTQTGYRIEYRRYG